MNGGDSFVLLSGQQVSGENEISFKQVRSVGFKWGVTNLLLSVPSGPPVIETTTLANAERDEAYTETLSASGGFPPLQWTVVSGVLPTGLGLSSGGVLSGTPREGGTFTFEVQVEDAANQVATQTLTLLVDTLDVVLTVGVLETGQYGHQYGGSNHLEELIATFTSTGESLVLDVDGYDIDYGNEVLVSLNGWRWITSVRGRVTS